MQNDSINFLMYIVYIPLVTIIHEFGHAAFVMLFRKEVQEISLGDGEELFRIKKFVVRKDSWWTGYCSFGNIDSLATYKKFLNYLGGIIFNLSTATCIWLFGDVQYADWYRSFIVASYFTALITIIPYKYNGSNLPSDGLQCVQLLRTVKRDI